MLPNIVFQIPQPSLIVIYQSLNIFPLREGHQIAVPGLMKTNDSRKPCHLGYLEQRVVIVFRRTEIQIHHNTPQSLNISVLYIVRFSFANRFRERTLYGDKLITLSTCDDSGKNSRVVIVAKRITEPR